jgi:hypothetical protein
MSIDRRVFVSVSPHHKLDPRRQMVRQAVLDRIRKRGYQLEITLESGEAAGLSWSFENIEKIMRRCIGAVALAFPRWSITQAGHELSLASEYIHYEGAVANVLGLPLLVIAETGLVDRGVTRTGGGHPILFITPGADASWVETEAFSSRFNVWADQLSRRKDVFLGYCSKSKPTAQAIHLFLTEKLGVKVLNWAMDLAGGGLILEEIERASRSCSCGIFLFTTDDRLDDGGPDRAAPRDNVVFEAGYFASSKGHTKALIVREEGAMMPADIGGSIYLLLRDRNDIQPIQTALKDFVEQRL